MSVVSWHNAQSNALLHHGTIAIASASKGQQLARFRDLGREFVEQTRIVDGAQALLCDAIPLRLDHEGRSVDGEPVYSNEANGDTFIIRVNGRERQDPAPSLAIEWTELENGRLLPDDTRQR